MMSSFNWAMCAFRASFCLLSSFQLVSISFRASVCSLIFVSAASLADWASSAKQALTSSSDCFLALATSISDLSSSISALRARFLRLPSFRLASMPRSVLDWASLISSISLFWSCTTFSASSLIFLSASMFRRSAAITSSILAISSLRASTAFWASAWAPCRASSRSRLSCSMLSLRTATASSIFLISSLRSSMARLASLCAMSTSLFSWALAVMIPCFSCATWVLRALFCWLS
mmetsp:Transcript_31430/g.66974  ORF Transcript_31430/g.66974 Transcript_31430/m.66974 type:complete len:234 (-) Transcript_31430:607-1308(-)